MSYMRMPMFCWTSLAASLLIVAAFPILTAMLAMLLLDRYAGFHFFTNEAGGNLMMFVNLIWAWGHPGGVHPGLAGVRCVLRSLLRPFPESLCSATAPWSPPPWSSASSPLRSGCITSSPWARARDVNARLRNLTIIIAVPPA